MPTAEIEERVAFLSEMIDDRIEEGLSEEEAVAQIGSVDEIVSRTVADAPHKKAKEKRSLNAWEIVLIILGSPIWLSLVIAAFAVIFSLYVSLWAVIISLWSVFAAFVACFIGGVAAGIIFAVCGSTMAGIAMIGCGVTLAGLSIFAYFGCRAATKGILILTKKAAAMIKNSFTKKEVAQ